MRREIHEERSRLLDGETGLVQETSRPVDLMKQRLQDPAETSAGSQPLRIGAAVTGGEGDAIEHRRFQGEKTTAETGRGAVTIIHDVQGAVSGAGGRKVDLRVIKLIEELFFPQIPVAAGAGRSAAVGGSGLILIFVFTVGEQVVEDQPAVSGDSIGMEIDRHRAVLENFPAQVACMKTGSLKQLVEEGAVNSFRTACGRLGDGGKFLRGNGCLIHTYFRVFSASWIHTHSAPLP